MYTLGKVPRSLLVHPQGGIVPNGTGGRRHAINRELLNRAAIDPGASRLFRVRTPSARLRLFVSVAYEPADGSDTTGGISPMVGGSCWGAVARMRDALTGKTGPMQPLWPFVMDANNIGQLLNSSRAIPDGYEADTSISEIEFNCKMGADGGLGVAGTWTAQATWEANEEMSTAELVELIDRCALEVEGSPTLFN